MIPWGDDAALARAIMAVEGNFSGSLLAAWTAGRTALLRPVEALGAVA